MRPATPLFLVLISPLIAACSTQTYTLDQWRSATDHTFSNTTPSRFESALQTAFESSRPGEYTLRPHGDGIIAERHWKEYAVIAYAEGTEHWEISYRQAGADLVARADVVNLPAVTIPVASSVPFRPDSPFTYDLLWQRVSYLLGQRSDWPSCTDYKAHLAPHSLDKVQEFGLCGIGADDALPPKRI